MKFICLDEQSRGSRVGSVRVLRLFVLSFFIGLIVGVFIVIFGRVLVFEIVQFFSVVGYWEVYILSGDVRFSLSVVINVGVRLFFFFLSRVYNRNFGGFSRIFLGCVIFDMCCVQFQTFCFLVWVNQGLGYGFYVIIIVRKFIDVFWCLFYIFLEKWKLKFRMALEGEGF